jgi:Protein of unknown function (DUF3830)
MDRLTISAGPFTFEATLEHADAPVTCEWFLANVPFESQVIHARWSGESAWIPLGDLMPDLPYENHTSHPSRGDILFYPGGISETEILLPYGSASFASKMGPLAGNHFLTITTGRERLAAFGHHVLWQGALPIIFDRTT